MCYHLLSAISCLCLLHTGLRAEECRQAVLAKRETLHVPAGGSLSLSCVVQHCGGAWTGSWMHRNLTNQKLTIVRHRVINETLSASQTRLILNFQSVNPSDEGSYGCSVKWAEGHTEQGNMKYVNVTAGLRAEECSPAVLAKRETLHVPAGGSLSLSCVVQHCGGAWTGSWMHRNSTNQKLTILRHRVINETLSASQTRLILNFQSVNTSDEGSYGCSVKWAEGDTEQGNMKYVNVTAAVPSHRSVLHRVLVCAAASLCLPIILGLARCLSSEVKLQPLPRTHAAVYRHQPHPAPQPPPRRPVPQKRSTSSHKATRQKTEVVYADISQDALRQQGATREPAESIVYSSLKFSSKNV